eukprot:gene24323-2999_t
MPSAFYNAANLATVTGMEGVTSIGESAFEECISLVSLNQDPATGINMLPPVEQLLSASFYKCEALQNIHIPESVRFVGDYTFELCAGLTAVSGMASVTHIGQEAFSGCIRLSDITFPSTDNGLQIAKWAFFDNRALASATIGGNATVGDEAFYNTACCPQTDCEWGAGISICQCTEPNRLQCAPGAGLVPPAPPSGSCAIEPDADGHVDIPEEWTHIGWTGFNPSSGSWSGSSGSGSSGSGYDDHAYDLFSGCESLISVHIPDSIIGIGESAFYGLKYIGDEAFYGCSALEVFSFGTLLTHIGDYAFYDASSLHTVELSPQVKVGSEAFFNLACCPGTDCGRSAKCPPPTLPPGGGGGGGSGGSNKGSPTGLIVGASIGGLVVVALLVVAFRLGISNAMLAKGKAYQQDVGGAEAMEAAHGATVSGTAAGDGSTAAEPTGGGFLRTEYEA